MRAQPLRACKSRKRRTRSADFLKSQSSTFSHSRVSSSRRFSRWMEESFRRSTSSREGTPGTGSSRAAMYRNYSVHGETKGNITAETRRRRENGKPSATDGVHGAGGRHELGAVDFVADPFGLDVR